MNKLRLPAGLLLAASNLRAQPAGVPAVGDATAPAEVPAEAAAPGVVAPPESPDIQDAREAFRQGSTLAKQGRWSDALAAFEQSARIKQHPVTTYNVAFCARALGQFVRAYQAFQAALSPVTGSPGVMLPAGYQTQARAYLAELKQRVAHASVTLGAPQVTVRVDGHFVAVLGHEGDRDAYFASASESEPRPLPRTFDLWLDPGSHVFIVSQRGFQDVTELHAFAPGGTQPLFFAEQAPGAPSRDERPRTAGPSKPDRTWAIVSLGVGAAGFVASGVFGVLSLNLKSTLEPRCANGVCPASDSDDVDRMKRFADYTTVGFVVGGAGAALGAYLWLTAKPARENARTTLRVTPWVGAGSAGVAARF
jgi:hypothetical protein